MESCGSMLPPALHCGLSTLASQFFRYFRVPSLRSHSSARTTELRITAERNQVPLKRFDAYSSSSSRSDENYRYGKKQSTTCVAEVRDRSTVVRFRCSCLSVAAAQKQIGMLFMFIPVIALSLSGNHRGPGPLHLEACQDPCDPMAYWTFDPP